MATERDHGLDTLLDLHGQTLFVDEHGHWVKFVVMRTEITSQRPHGLRYSLTLHAPDGERLVGFDNAQPVRERLGPGTRRLRQSDHLHCESHWTVRLQGRCDTARGFLERSRRHSQGKGAVT